MKTVTPEIASKRQQAREKYLEKMKNPVYRDAQKVKWAAYAKEYNKRPERNTPEVRAKKKAADDQWRSRPDVKARLREYQKPKRRLWRYGITVEERDTMIESQNEVCQICKKAPTRWTIDHCHTTGKVRGALCNICNAALGGFRDSVENLQSAIQYLCKFQEFKANE